MNYKDYEINGIYIPEQYNNQSYKYILDGENINIITNKNCYTNYNTTYCDTYKYNMRTNVITEPYPSNSNQTNNIIKYEYITSDINNNTYIKDRYMNYIGVSLLMILIGIMFATFLTRERSSY